MNATFADFLMVTAAEMPVIEQVHTETPLAEQSARGQGHGGGGHHPGLGDDRQRPRGRARAVAVDRMPVMPEDVLGLLELGRARGSVGSPPRPSYSPVDPSISSRRMSACPLWRAVSSIMWLRTRRTSVGPWRGWLERHVERGDAGRDAAAPRARRDVALDDPFGGLVRLDPEVRVRDRPRSSTATARRGRPPGSRTSCARPRSGA